MAEIPKLATADLLNGLMAKLRKDIGAALAEAFEDGRRSGLNENRAALQRQMEVGVEAIGAGQGPFRGGGTVTLRQAVLDALLSAERGLSQKEVLAELKRNPYVVSFKPESVKVTLHRLKRDKLIVNAENGRWHKV